MSPLPSTGDREEPLERVRGEQYVEVEAEPDRRLRGEGRDQRVLPEPPLEQGDAGAGDRKHRHPEQHRAFVISPGAGEFVEPGLQRMAVRRDQLHREVGAQEQPDQAEEGEADEHALRHRHRPHDPRQRLVARPQRRGAEDELEQRQARREPEQGKAGFGDHLTWSVWCMPRRVELGRHVILVMLGEDLGGGEAAVGLEAALGDDAAALAEQVRA